MENKRIFKLVLTALMSTLCYVSFALLKISIPTPAGYTSFHLGNVFCVLAALIIDGVSGGIAGAIGMGIGDLLDPRYIVTAPKTLILKFFIGYITGSLAHKVFKITEKQEINKKDVVLSISGGMLFNIIGEPVLSYIYYSLILNNVDKAASYLTVAKWVTTSVNSVLTIIIGTILYLAIIKRIKNNKYYIDLLKK